MREDVWRPRFAHVTVYELAADVCQTMFYFLSTGRLAAALPPEACLGALVAACAHDVVRVNV